MLRLGVKDKKLHVLVMYAMDRGNPCVVGSEKKLASRDINCAIVWIPQLCPQRNQVPVRQLLQRGGTKVMLHNWRAHLPRLPKNTPVLKKAVRLVLLKSFPMDTDFLTVVPPSQTYTGPLRRVIDDHPPPGAHVPSTLDITYGTNLPWDRNRFRKVRIVPWVWALCKLTQQSAQHAIAHVHLPRRRHSAPLRDEVTDDASGSMVDPVAE